MNMRSSRWCNVVLLALTALWLTCGCTSPPRKPQPYTAENPGPWGEAMPEAPKVTVEGGMARIEADYKARMGDFVNRIIVRDDRGDEIGNLAVNFGDPVEAGFKLPEGTKSVTFYLISTKRGTYRCRTVPVVEVPAPKK
jgi:hypothetical protein